MTLAALLDEQRRAHGPRRLLENLGDGFLYLQNPYFRRIRDAAAARKIGFTLQDPGDYFAFPLVALDSVLRARKVPYRANYSALCAFERARPGFFTLADLRRNRPQPNYVLHESAHAIAFHELLGRPREVSVALSDPQNLVRVVLGEAYAMTCEYFAACAVSGVLHAWFFSINSYRHRTPAKKRVGELMSELGPELLVWLILCGFLANNFFIERLSARALDRALELSPVAVPRISSVKRKALCRAISELMVMSPEFREDTARLFFAMHGYSRAIRRVLSADPLALIAAENTLERPLRVLVTILAAD